MVLGAPGGGCDPNLLFHWWKTPLDSLFCIKSIKVSFKCKSITSYFLPSLLGLLLYLARLLLDCNLLDARAPVLFIRVFSFPAQCLAYLVCAQEIPVTFDTLYLISLLYEAGCGIGTEIQDRYPLRRRQGYQGQSSFSGHYFPVTGLTVCPFFSQRCWGTRSWRICLVSVSQPRAINVRGDGSHTFWSQDLFTLLKITEDPNELLLLTC